MPSSDEDLLQFVSGVTSTDVLRIEEDLGGGFVRLSATEAQRRQARHDIRCVEDVLVELLRNSRDAGARSIFVSSSKDAEGIRRIQVIDDGCGIPRSLHGAVFQPRVTSKLDSLVMDEYGVHGRGMALYSVAETAMEASVAFSAAGLGTSFSFTFDTAALSEKKDQSTSPVVRVRNGERQVVRGPKNLVRTVVEFALRHPDISVYFGSPADITATLFHLGSDPADERANSGPWKVFCTCVDGPGVHRAAAEALAVPLSLRNAFRVFANEIAPLSPVLGQGSGSKLRVSRMEQLESHQGASPKLSIRLSEDDIVELRQAVESAFAPTLQRYFVHQAGEAKISLGPDGIKIVIPLGSQE